MEMDISIEQRYKLPGCGLKIRLSAVQFYPSVHFSREAQMIFRIDWKNVYG